MVTNNRKAPEPSAAMPAEEDEALTDQEQAEWDALLRAEIQQELDDPSPGVSNEEVERYFATVRAELKKRIESEGS